MEIGQCQEAQGGENKDTVVLHLIGPSVCPHAKISSPPFSPLSPPSPFPPSVPSPLVTPVTLVTSLVTQLDDLYPLYWDLCIYQLYKNQRTQKYSALPGVLHVLHGDTRRHPGCFYCCCCCLLQMIIRSDWPLANDHPEGLASCK